MQYFTKKNIDDIVKYLKPLKEKLADYYAIPMKNENTLKQRLKDILRQEQADWLYEEYTPFEFQLALKEHLGQYLRLLPTTSEQETLNKNLVKWIIEDWGGITSIKDNNYSDKYSFDQIIKNPQIYEAIASRSKVFSFYNPTQYAICDARVLFSLNHILLKHNHTDLFFPPLPTKNGTLFSYSDDHEIKRQYRHLHDRTVRNSIAAWEKQLYIKKRKAFETYCELVRLVHKDLYGNDKLYYTEMLLFSIADNEIIDLIRS